MMTTSSGSIEVRCPVGTDVLVGSASGPRRPRRRARDRTGHHRERLDRRRDRRLGRPPHPLGPRRGAGVPRVLPGGEPQWAHRGPAGGRDLGAGRVGHGRRARRRRARADGERSHPGGDGRRRRRGDRVGQGRGAGARRRAPSRGRARAGPGARRRARRRRQRALDPDRERIGPGAFGMTATSAPPSVVSGAVLFTDLVGFTEFTAVQGDRRRGRAARPPGGDRRRRPCPRGPGW